jgi:hypothetical protein
MNIRTVSATALTAGLLVLGACGVTNDYDDARDQVDDAVSQTVDQIEQINEQVNEQLEDQLDDQLDGQLDGRLDDQLEQLGELSQVEDLEDLQDLQDGRGSTDVPLLERRPLEAALAALAASVGEPDPQATQVIVSADYVELDATDPAARDELNSWTFRGRATGSSSPVDYGGDVAALEANVFRLSDLDARTIARFAKTAVAASGVEGGELVNVIIKRNLPFDAGVVMFANVDGDRGSKQVRAGVDGKVFEVV